MKIKEKYMPWMLLAPALILLFFVSIYPLIYSINMSFHRWSIAKPWLGYHFIGFANYVRIFQDLHFWNAMKNTLIFAVTVVNVESLLGLGIAFLLSIELKGRKIMRACVLIPMMLTPVVVGLMWKYMLNQTFGVINHFLKLVGIKSIIWYGDPSLVLTTMIMIDIWQWTPFAILVSLAGLSSLPIELFDSTKVDGASRWQTFRYVTLPLLKPVMAIVIILRLIDATKIFDTIFVMTRGGPALASETFSIFAYREAIFLGNIGYGAALSWVLLFFITIICMLFIRIIRMR